MTETEDPIERFAAWMREATESEPRDPTAMSLATVDGDGAPSLRMVLLKAVDSRGFVFYTNTESRKGIELDGNPNAALCFYWKSLGRQIRIDGVAEAVSGEEADAYFASRHRDSRIGAWASAQSRPMSGRFDLEKAVAKYAAKHAIGNIPRPPYWSGYRIVPNRIEFWREKPFRLHERLVFIRDGEGWRTEMLFP